MLVSIVISTCNEGDNLCKTVQSCLAASRDIRTEIIVSDDASSDGSIERLIQCYPEVHVLRHANCKGVAATKDLGARGANGSILVFLDAHCNIESKALRLLVTDIEELNAPAIVVPRIATLDCATWENSTTTLGTGYLLDLESFQERWVPLSTLRRSGRLFESPNLAGCCLAVPKQLYEDLGGFDCAMRGWGSEHVDFGLKAWLLGYRILNDLEAVVGHRFQAGDHLIVPEPRVLANQIRLAWKHFSNNTRDDWLERCKARNSPQTWHAAWTLFEIDQCSATAEHAQLIQRRVRDVEWYAWEFDLKWPRCLASRPTPEFFLKDQLYMSSRFVENANAVGFARSEQDVLTIVLRIGRRLSGVPDIEGAAFHWAGGATILATTIRLLKKVDRRSLRYALSIEPDQVVSDFADDPAIPKAAAVSIAALRDALKPFIKNTRA